ncbi:CoA ester lyase [Desulfothermus okinawensis JCM 13304]
MDKVTLQRSTISVPANRERMLVKSKNLNADFIMYDLEDSVGISEKDIARDMLIDFLSSEDLNNKAISYRINEIRSPFAYKDVIYVIEKVGYKIQSIVVPKVESRDEIQWIHILLDQIEKSIGLNRKIEIEASIETARGMLNIKEIVNSSNRIRSLVFGIADYTVSLGMFFKGYSGHGEEEEFYPGHRFHYPLSRIAMAAKSKGILAIDAPYGNFKDLEGLKRSCLLSKYLGFDGKWAIHPSQIEVINKVYSPEEEDIERCKKIVETFEESLKGEKGSASIDGRMIDGATYRLAKSILDKASKINE